MTEPEARAAVKAFLGSRAAVCVHAGRTFSIVAIAGDSDGDDADQFFGNGETLREAVDDLRDGWLDSLPPDEQTIRPDDICPQRYA